MHEQGHVDKKIIIILAWLAPEWINANMHYEDAFMMVCAYSLHSPGKQTAPRGICLFGGDTKNNHNNNDWQVFPFISM